MTRRTFLLLHLTADSPFAVADPRQATDECDLPVIRDPHGNVYVPGTSVAGSLRAHLRSIDSVLTVRLLGSASDDEDAPSVLRILGVVTMPPSDDPPEVSRRTAIDRVRAAARNRTLHAAEQLPFGTLIDVYMRCDDLDDTDLTWLTGAMGSWQPRLGRSITSGLGNFSATGLQVGTLDLLRPGDRRRWLTSGGPDLVRDVATKPVPLETKVQGPLRNLTWDVVDALHIGSGRYQQSTPEGPLVAQVLTRNGQYVIPGTSWKGVLRSRAEFILRCVGEEVCLEATCGKCRTCRLFGWAPGAGSTALGGRGALAIHDAVVNEAIVTERTHVAIDRFMGGAATGRRRGDNFEAITKADCEAGLLYTQQVVTSGRTTLVIDKLGPVSQDDETLLDLVIRDIDDGLVGVGSATTRGQGTLQLVDDAQRNGFTAACWGQPQSEDVA